MQPGEPGRRQHWILEAVQQLPLAKLVGHDPTKPVAAAIRAGILQMNDFLDASHSQSQSVEGAQDADYWHAIMHRREGDYWNSKYWLGRTGRHEIFSPLHEAARAVAERHGSPDEVRWLIEPSRWDGGAFVDLVEAVTAGRSDAADLARDIQQAEWSLLFDHCYRRALGA